MLSGGQKERSGPYGILAATLPSDTKWACSLRPVIASSDRRTPTLPAVIGAWFGVDEDAEQLGSLLLEASLQFGRDFVHAGERQFVRQGAVAGNIQVPAHPLDAHFVHIEHFRERLRDGFQALLERGIASDLVAAF